jgi:hypothetical protein
MESPARLRPALERAWPADGVQDGTWRQEGIPCDALFRDGQWHPAWLVARWLDGHGREAVQLEWFAEMDAWGGEFVAEPGKIREA